MCEKKSYLFDTHALVFWNNKESVSEKFIKFFDKQNQQERLYISSISFWEIALLVKKGRIAISDVHAWKNEILNNTNIKVINPSVSERVVYAVKRREIYVLHCFQKKSTRGIKTPKEED